MTDATLNRFISSGTNAERLAFTPDPPTPASGPDPSYIWFETDTLDTYAWDYAGSSWEQVNTGGAAAGLVDGDYGDVTSAGGTITIDAGAVTLAKQANMATASVVYRKTAGAGAPEVQTLATLKTDLALTGTNSGDQTTIVGITGTKAEFDAAVSDGNIVYVGDSPELTAVNLGHASDTTITRTGAGDIAVEGNTVYRAGGTDIPLTDGGTGVSLADPGADSGLFWDDSAGNIAFFTAGLGLEFSTTTLRRASGTSFPGSPASGDLFWRSDRNIEYFYDGTRWLSTQIFVLPQTPEVAAATTTSFPRWGNPWAGVYDIYLEKLVATTVNGSGTPASNYMVFQLRKRDGTSATDVGGTISTQGDTQNAYTAKSVTINAVVASDQEGFDFSVTETGTASTFFIPSLIYRLVG